MQHKAGESIREDTNSAFVDLYYSRGHIVKPKHRRNTVNVFKDAFPALQQALLVLSRKCLRVPLIGVREGAEQCIAGQFFSFCIPIEEGTEVHLSIGHGMIYRKVPLLQLFHNPFYW